MTFPFPQNLTPRNDPSTFASDPHAIAIATAARTLNDLRERWINPTDLVRSVQDATHLPARFEALDLKSAKELKKRTLTNLYNLFPAWLRNAHHDLDVAVSAAYGWPNSASDDEILQLLLAENLRRVAAQGLDLGSSDSDDEEELDDEE